MSSVSLSPSISVAGGLNGMTTDPFSVVTGYLFTHEVHTLSGVSRRVRQCVIAVMGLVKHLDLAYVEKVIAGTAKLKGNGIDDKGMEAFHFYKRLTSLDFSSYEITGIGVKILGQALSSKTMVSLNLTGNLSRKRILPEEIKMLFQNINLANLQHLGLGAFACGSSPFADPISTLSFNDLLELLTRCQQLKTLSLKPSHGGFCQPLAPDRASALIGLLPKTIEEIDSGSLILYMTNDLIDSLIRRDLTNILRCDIRDEYLSVSREKLGNLLDNLPLRQMTHISICALPSKDYFPIIAAQLKQNSSLEELNLGCTSSTPGALKFVQDLGDFPSLRRLSVDMDVYDYSVPRPNEHPPMVMEKLKLWPNIESIQFNDYELKGEELKAARLNFP